MNLIDFFDRSAATFPGRPALIFEDRAFAYRDVREFAAPVAHGLAGLGVARETKCAVLSRNDPFAFMALLGILKARATWVPLNPARGGDENLFITAFFDVEVLFYQSEFEPFARLVRERIPQVRHFIVLDRPGALRPHIEEWASTQPNAPIW